MTNELSMTTQQYLDSLEETEEFSVATRRAAFDIVIKATIDYHPADPADQVVRQETGSLDWALSYASTYFERGAWAAEKVRLIEVLVRGQVVAAYTPRIKN
jgi:hypothetical protein